MNFIKGFKPNMTHVYYFFVYSFIGWCIESAYVSITQARLVSRGVLFGPLCPIYGFASLMMILILEPLKKNIIVFFISSVLLATTLEYWTGVVMRELFLISIWDYSMEFMNINGLICLKFSIIWGFLAIFFLYFLHPHITLIIERIPAYRKRTFSSTAMIIVLIDCMISLYYYYENLINSFTGTLTQYLTEKITDYGNRYINVLWSLLK